MYRGQKCAKWKLQSGAVERIISEETVQLQTLIEYHNTLLESVRLRGWNWDSNGRELGDLELLAKLQHHGAATCLLDFTTRFDIALWFACQEVNQQEVEEDDDESKKGKIFIAIIDQDAQSGLGKVRSDELEKKIDYFLHPESRSKKAGNEAGEQTSENSEELRQLEEERDKVKFWYWEPETLMGRMLSQESRFLFGPQGIPEEICLYIEIEEEHKDGLIRELRQQQGLRPETVFSDIHGYADINARNKPWKIKSYEDYMQAGWDKFSAGDEFADALKEFDKAIKLDPNRADAWFYAGMAKERMGMHEAAIKNFDEVIRLDEKLAAAWHRRGMAKRRLKRYEEAIDDYGKAIKLDEEFVVAWFNRGFAKERLNRYEDAITDYDEAIKLNEEFVTAWYRRGFVKERLNQYEEAVTDYDEAIRLNKEFAAAWYRRGLAKERLNRYEEAVSDYDEAIRLNEEFAAAWYRRGLVKERLNRYEEAVSDYDEAIRLNEEFAIAWYRRGRAKTKLGYHEGAHLNMEQALILFQKRGSVAWQERTKERIVELDELLKEKVELPDFE